MFRGRTINSEVNRLHCRALRIVYRDDTSTFDELLDKDGSITVHHRNLQFLAIEMYKLVHGLSPLFMADIFCNNTNLHSENVSANTRSKSRFCNPSTTIYGLETLRCLGPKIWNMVPHDMKNAKSVANCKTKIRKWKPVNCPCRICATFIPNLGFL